MPSWCFYPFIITSWLFVPCYYFALRFIFWGISMTIPAFFYFPFACNIIFSSFILSLYVSVELKQVSWRHHAVQYWFLIHPTTLCLLIWWVQSIYISDDCWYVRTYYCEFIFCFLIISYLYSFFFCFCLFNGWFSMVICSVFLFMFAVCTLDFCFLNTVKFE